MTIAPAAMVNSNINNAGLIARAGNTSAETASRSCRASIMDRYYSLPLNIEIERDDRGRLRFDRDRRVIFETITRRYCVIRVTFDEPCFARFHPSPWLDSRWFTLCRFAFRLYDEIKVASFFIRGNSLKRSCHVYAMTYELCENC